MVSLDQLKPGQRARIETVQGSDVVVQRLLEMGLLEGDEIEVITLAPMGDPMEIRRGDTRLSLRRIDAAHLIMTPLS